MASDAHVPVGTVADFEGLPRTVLRDYDTVIIPAVQVTLDGLDLLEAVLADARQQVRDYQASVDEDDIDAPVSAATPGHGFLDECQAVHCPPSVNGMCDWPRCAETWCPLCQVRHEPGAPCTPTATSA